MAFLYHYYIWLIIFLFSGMNIVFYKIIKSQVDVLIIVFINLILLLFFLYPYLNKISKKISNDDFLSFLNVSKGSIKFTDLTTFLGEQALGSLLATLTIVYGREVFKITNSGAITAIFIYIIFLLTISITTLSLAKISLQTINLNLNRFKEFLLIIIFFFITYWAYIGGLKLVPSIP
ncbi:MULTISPECIES: hypothetical protein [Acinetobacter]|uniref:hypothetical protein n=1 Tax=Acinetobacter TaxID=469 RepID=UPI0015D3596C|nr:MULTISPECIES: hypothetical protein [Acinetobacter]MCL6232481.1 hypothetical protein [Acinetobacter amyesii]